MSTLLETHNIAFDGPRGGQPRAAANAVRRDRKPTHAVVVERGRKVLRRARFACPASGCAPGCAG